jgi:hypothetical protein
MGYGKSIQNGKNKPKIAEPAARVSFHGLLSFFMSRTATRDCYGYYNTAARDEDRDFFSCFSLKSCHYS